MAEAEIGKCPTFMIGDTTHLENMRNEAENDAPLIHASKDRQWRNVEP